MFDLPVIVYLFLGGTGAGALVLLGIAEFADALWVLRCARGTGSRCLRLAGGGLPAEWYCRSWGACSAFLALGILCLLFDLGRPDRVGLLLARPALSPISVGAFALGASLMLAAFFALLEWSGTSLRPAAVLALSVAGVATGLVSATYTGVLLQGMASVALWHTPLLPALFALSSLSCGAAVLFACVAFSQRDTVLAALRDRILRVDAVLVALEAVCLAALVCAGLAGAPSREAARQLVAGELAPVFWGGVVALAIVAPAVLGRCITRENHPAQLLRIAGCALAGGLALRWCMVTAGLYDASRSADALVSIMLGA